MTYHFTILSFHYHFFLLSFLFTILSRYPFPLSFLFTILSFYYLFFSLSFLFTILSFQYPFSRYPFFSLFFLFTRAACSEEVCCGSEGLWKSLHKALERVCKLGYRWPRLAAERERARARARGCWLLFLDLDFFYCDRCFFVSDWEREANGEGYFSEGEEYVLAIERERLGGREGELF